MKHTHNTPPRVEPRILRTHRLITQGVDAQQADAFVRAAVESLQSLGTAPAPPMHIAPPSRPELCELLRKSGLLAKSFGPLIVESGTATINQEAA